MSTVVDKALPRSPHASVGDRGPAISAHAELRFLERHVDARAARTARKSAASEHAALEMLAKDYQKELESYRGRVHQAVTHLTERLGTIPFRNYTIRSGPLSLVMVGETCVTTLPHRVAARPVRKRGSRRPAKQWQ